MASCNTGLGNVSNGECSGSYWGLISNISQCPKRMSEQDYIKVILSPPPEGKLRKSG